MPTNADLHEQLNDLAQQYRPRPLSADQLLRQHVVARRRRVVSAGVAASLALVAGSIVLSGTSHRDRASVSQFADPTRTAAAGSGRAWLLDVPTPQHSDGTYYDPEDEDDVPTASEPPVSQPPYDELLSGLRAEVERAGLPDGSRITVERGGIGLATLRILLPDGMPMIVIRDRYTHPIRFRMSSRDGIGKGITVEDVPGTTSAALIDPDFPYGFGRGYPLQANGVVVVTADGWTTSWTAPTTLRQEALRAWAFEGAQSPTAANG